jgi:hypothetical protein
MLVEKKDIFLEIVPIKEETVVEVVAMAVGIIMVLEVLAIMEEVKNQENVLEIITSQKKVTTCLPIKEEE